MSLAFFLSCLTGHARPRLHRPQWREHLGIPALTLLERTGWLRNEGRADWYPCGGACSGSDLRRVLPDPTENNLWRVECPTFECLDEEVPPGELELLAAEGNALALWLREQLQASGAPLNSGPPGVHGLGRVLWREQVREGLLVTGTLPPDLPSLLRDLQDMTPSSVVFVPQIRILPATLRGAHGPRSATMLVGLDELLEQRDGRILLQQPWMAVREPAAPAYAAEPIVAEVFEATGQRGLSASACALLIEKRASFDLFLDLTSVVEGSRHPASKRDASGKVQSSSLSRHEAEAMAELVRRRVALGQGEFKTVPVRAIHKLIDGVRRALDVNLGRFDWRSIHTIRGETVEKRRWLFRPPAALKFAVLIPVRG